MWEFIFWAGILITGYTYVGYGVVITLLAALKSKKGDMETGGELFEPPVSVIIAAYNEEDYIEKKAENTLGLDYPASKKEIIFVTDGSTDSTPDLLQKVDGVKVMHKPGRSGKIAAMERAAEQASNPILIFTDANAMLNKEAIRNIVKHYADPRVGAVAGEKSIMMLDEEDASGAGEGIYWKYESYLKKKDFETYSVVGAAGELFSVRKELYEPVEPDTLLDDFIMTLRVAEKGFRVAYAPDAVASERPSASSLDEMTRKVRIAAGGIQSIVRLKSLLNPFKHGMLTFQYVSHRVLRWTIAPLMLPLIFASNFMLHLSQGGFYTILFILQILFYIFSALGYLFESKRVRIKLFFVPYYFSLMNICVYLGAVRYFRGGQSVNWKRAKRAK